MDETVDELLAQIYEAELSVSMEVPALKSPSFDLEAKIKAVREIIDGEAREANRLLKEYADKPKAPLHVTSPFGGTRVVDS